MLQWLLLPIGEQYVLLSENRPLLLWLDSSSVLTHEDFLDGHTAFDVISAREQPANHSKEEP